MKVTVHSLQVSIDKSIVVVVFLIATFDWLQQQHKNDGGGRLEYNEEETAQRKSTIFSFFYAT